MSSKVRRRVTVEGSKSSDNGQSKRQSVFDRLGPGSTSISSSERHSGDRPEKCRNWLRTGSCPYGNTCRFQHGPFSSSSKRTPHNRSEERRTENMRSKMHSSSEKSAKKSRNTSESPKKITHRSSSSRNKKKEHENKIKSTVVVTRKPSSRSGKEQNPNWDDSATTDEEWSPEELDYKEVLTLELERQKLQRELELEIQKDQEKKRENVVIQKMVVSSSDSDSSQSSSSSSSSCSSSSSSPPPRPKKKEHKGPQTPPVAINPVKKKSFFKEKAKSQEENLSSSKNKGPRTPSPFETTARDTKREIRDKDAEDERETQKERYRRHRKSPERNTSPSPRIATSSGQFEPKKNIKSRRNNYSPKSQSPSRPNLSDYRHQPSPDHSRLEIGKNKRGPSPKDRNKSRQSPIIDKVRYRGRSSSENRSPKGRNSHSPDSFKHRKLSPLSRHTEARIKSVAATVNQDRAQLSQRSNSPENRQRNKFQKEYASSNKRISPPEKEKRRQHSPESYKHELVGRASSPRDHHDRERLTRDKGGRLRDDHLYNERSRPTSPEPIPRRLDNRHGRGDSPDSHSRPTSRESRSTRTATTHQSRSPEPRSRPSTPEFLNRRGSPPYHGPQRNYPDSASRLSPNNRGRRSPDTQRRNISPESRTRSNIPPDIRNRRMPSPETRMRRLPSPVGRGRQSPPINRRPPSPEFNRHYPPSPEMRGRLPSPRNDFVPFDPMFNKNHRLPYEDRIIFDPQLMQREEFSPVRRGSPRRQMDRDRGGFDKYGSMRSPPRPDRFGRFESRSPPRPDLEYEYESPRRRITPNYQSSTRGMRGRGRLSRGRSGFIPGNREARFDRGRGGRLDPPGPGHQPFRGEWEDRQFDERDVALERRRELENLRIPGRKRPREEETPNHPVVKRRREDSPPDSRSYSGRDTLPERERPDRLNRGNRLERIRKMGFNKSDYSESNYRDNDRRDDKLRPDDSLRDEVPDPDIVREERVILRKRGRAESPEHVKEPEAEIPFRKRAKISDGDYQGFLETEAIKNMGPTPPKYEYAEERAKNSREKDKEVREKEWGKEKDRSKEKERGKDKERGKEKDRGKEVERTKEIERLKEVERSKEVEKPRERFKERGKDKEKDKDKEREKERHKDCDRVAEVDADHKTDGVNNEPPGVEPFSDWSDEEDDILTRDEDNNVIVAASVVREEIDKHSVKSNESWPHHKDVQDLREGRGASHSSDGSVSRSSPFPSGKHNRSSRGRERLQELQHFNTDGRFLQDRSRSNSRHASEERQSRRNHDRILPEKFQDRGIHSECLVGEGLVAELPKFKIFEYDQKSLDSYRSHDPLDLPCSRQDTFTYEIISDDEFDPTLDDGLDDDHLENNEGRKPCIVDALEVDWTSLRKDYRPKFDVTPGSSLKRFTAVRVLSRIGVSKALAGPTLMGKIQNICEKQLELEAKEVSDPASTQEKTETDHTEIKSEDNDNSETSCEVKVDKKQDIKSEKSNDSSDSSPSHHRKLEFEHDIAAFHASAVKRKQERMALISNIGQYRRALCARRDLWIRKQLCRITDKSSEAMSSVYSQTVDNELYKLSLQLFRQHKSGIEQKSLIKTTEIVCSS